MNRELFALQHEGSLIEYAGKAGREAAAAHGRAIIDGLANGLIRLEGAEACAPYFLALGDRVCGGVRALTFFTAPPEQAAIGQEVAAEVASPMEVISREVTAAAESLARDVAAAMAKEVVPATEDAAPGEPTLEEEPPAYAAQPAGPAWRPIVAFLLIALGLALAWRAGFVAGRGW